MTKEHKRLLDAEVRRLLEHGAEYVSIPEYYRRWDEAGFKFDHSCDIREFARYISGPYAGELSPELNLYPVHKALKISAFHVDLPEADRKKVKELRRAFFAVSHDGYILNV